MNRSSVVSTLYRSAPYLREFYLRTVAVARRFSPEYELVLVNDGSPDDALEVALELREADPRVCVVDLSRNFGHHPAIMTGLAHATGDWVFLIDCDLEEDPGLLDQFAAVQQQTGADVVYGVQERRGGTLLDRWSGAAFYRVFNLLSPEPLPPNLMTVRLMSRRYIDALLSHREVEFIIAGLWQRTGFEQVAVPVRKQRRRDTTYNWPRKIAILVNAVTSFSRKPLTWIFYLGAGLTSVALAAITVLVGYRVLIGPLLDGWASLMVSIWFLSGVIIFCQGVIGIYLGKVFAETKRRPVSIVRHVYGARTETKHDRPDRLKRAG